MNCWRAILIVGIGMGGCDAQQEPPLDRTGVTAEVIALMPPINALGTAPYELAKEVAALTQGSLQLQVRQADDVGVTIPQA